MSKDHYPCASFEIALNASFQECGKCGWPKADHKPMKRKNLIKEYEKRTQGQVGKVLSVQKKEQKESEPCDHFDRDLSAKEYEICHCGWTLLEHEEAKEFRAKKALEQLKLEEQRKNAVNFREEAKRLGVACSQFEVDVNNTTGGYGVCLCGKPREEHTDYKTSGKQYTETKEKLTAPKPFI